MSHRSAALIHGLDLLGAARAMAQLERDASLRRAGFEVVHFTWRDITRTPGDVAASIQAAFLRASILNRERLRVR